MTVLRRGLGRVRCDLPRMTRLTLNNATINAKLGARPRCTHHMTSRLTIVAYTPFIATPGGFRTLTAYSTLIRTRNTLGKLTTSLVGVTGSIH